MSSLDGKQLNAPSSGQAVFRDHCFASSAILRLQRMSHSTGRAAASPTISQCPVRADIDFRTIFQTGKHSHARWYLPKNGKENIIVTCNYTQSTDDLVSAISNLDCMISIIAGRTFCRCQTLFQIHKLPHCVHRYGIETELSLTVGAFLSRDLGLHLATSQTRIKANRLFLLSKGTSCTIPGGIQHTVPPIFHSQNKQAGGSLPFVKTRWLISSRFLGFQRIFGH